MFIDQTKHVVELNFSALMYLDVFVTHKMLQMEETEWERQMDRSSDQISVGKATLKLNNLKQFNYRKATYLKKSLAKAKNVVSYTTSYYDEKLNIIKLLIGEYYIHECIHSTFNLH